MPIDKLNTSRPDSMVLSSTAYLANYCRNRLRLELVIVHLYLFGYRALAPRLATIGVLFNHVVLRKILPNWTFLAPCDPLMTSTHGPIQIRRHFWSQRLADQLLPLFRQLTGRLNGGS